MAITEVQFSQSGYGVTIKTGFVSEYVAEDIVAVALKRLVRSLSDNEFKTLKEATYERRD